MTVLDIEPCPHCGSTRGTWFDRCMYPPCYMMHDICEDCGKPVQCVTPCDDCEHMERDDAETEEPN